MTRSSTPIVSVAMPVYNAAAYIEESVQSILNQTLSDFELLISDNASTDNSAALCEQLAARDPRIRLVRQAINIGANRNYVVVQRMARAPYIKWASSNDLCAPTFLERCVEQLERDPRAVLSMPQVMIFDSDPAKAEPYARSQALQEEKAVDRFRAYFTRCLGLNNAINGVIRSDALNACLPLGVYGSADVVLMAELALRGKFLEVPEPLFFRRVSSAAATSYRSMREAELHIAPESRGELRWQRWIYHGNLLRAAARAASNSADLLRATHFAMRTMLWSRRGLLKDFEQVLLRRS